MEAEKQAAASAATAEAERNAAAAAAAAKVKALEDAKVKAYLERKAAIEAAKVRARFSAGLFSSSNIHCHLFPPLICPPSNFLFPGCCSSSS
jgi:hypothetical protein